MVRSAHGFFHQLPMAIGTQLRIVAGSQQEFVVVGAVGSMAGLAFPLDDRQVRVCFPKCYFGIKMTGVTHRIGLAFEHSVKIRTVGVMTGVTFSLDEGRVADMVFLISFGFRMAAKAQGRFFGDQKFVRLGRMFLMTGQSSPALGQCFVRGLRRYILSGVAVKTECIAALGQQNRVFRGMRGMTGSALSFRKRLMFNGAAGLQIGRVVAFLAKLGTLLSGGKGVLS